MTYTGISVIDGSKSRGQRGQIADTGIKLQNDVFSQNVDPDEDDVTQIPDVEQGPRA